MEKYLNIDLQLFAEDGDTDGVVDHQEDLEDIEETEYVEDESEYIEDEETEIEDEESEEPEAADPERTQSPEENAQYKKMRLKAEHDARKELEAERQAIENERLEIQRARQEREAEQAERRVYANHITQENIESKAYEYNVTEDVARKLLEHEVSSIVQAEKNKVLQRFNILQAQKESLKGDEYYHLIEKDVDRIVDANPNIDFQTAYHYTVGQRRKELEKQVVKKAVKSTVANMQDRARRKTVSSDGGSEDRVNPSAILGKDELDMCSAFGTDPREIAKYVKSNKKKR